MGLIEVSEIVALPWEVDFAGSDSLGKVGRLVQCIQTQYCIYRSNIFLMQSMPLFPAKHNYRKLGKSQATLLTEQLVLYRDKFDRRGLKSTYKQVYHNLNGNDKAIC